MIFTPEHFGKKFIKSDDEQGEFFIPLAITSAGQVIGEDETGRMNSTQNSFFDDWKPYKETSYSIGNRFKNSYGSEYLLAQVGAGKVNLICLAGGNRWTEEISVKSVHNITEGELNGLIRYGGFPRSFSKQFERINE